MVLVGRLKIISVLAVSISLFGIFLLLYEMYRVAREFARNARLDRENQLLAMESRRYMELQTSGQHPAVCDTTPAAPACDRRIDRDRAARGAEKLSAPVRKRA